MKKFISVLFFFVVAFAAHAAINAQYTFEGAVPDFVSSNGGKVELSQEKFKDGKSSVKFSWDAPSAELVFSNVSDIEASMKVNEAGLMMWVYNPQPMSEPIVFSFLDWNMNEICHFDFNADFKGWRAVWIKYIDMLAPYGHYGDKKRSAIPRSYELLFHKRNGLGPLLRGRS